VIDPTRSIKYIDVRRQTFQYKMNLLDNYFNKNNADYSIRSSSIDANMPLNMGEVRYYEYKEHRLIDIISEDGLVDGIYLDNRHIDLIQILEMRDRFYYRV
jgi:hypothetical protein